MRCVPLTLNTWLGLWCCDDEWWNDKVGPWDILSQREACSWRCGDTAVGQRERGDMCAAITVLQRRLPPPYHSSETRAFVFVTTPRLLNSISEDWHTCDILSILDLSLSSLTSAVFFAACARKDGATTKKWTARPVRVDRSAKANNVVYLCVLFRQKPSPLSPFLHNLVHLRETAQLHSTLWNDSYKSNVLCPGRNLMPHTNLSCAI